MCSSLLANRKYCVAWGVFSYASLDPDSVLAVGSCQEQTIPRIDPRCYLLVPEAMRRDLQVCNMRHPCRRAVVLITARDRIKTRHDGHTQKPTSIH